MAAAPRRGEDGRLASPDVEMLQEAAARPAAHGALRRSKAGTLAGWACSEAGAPQGALEPCGP